MKPIKDRFGEKLEFFYRGTMGLIRCSKCFYSPVRTITETIEAIEILLTLDEGKRLLKRLSVWIDKTEKKHEKAPKKDKP